MNGLVTLPTFLSVFPQMKDSQIEGENRYRGYVCSSMFTHCLQGPLLLFTRSDVRLALFHVLSSVMYSDDAVCCLLPGFSSSSE